MGLSFEIQIAIYAAIHTLSQKKVGQYQHSVIQFLTDFAFLINSRKKRLSHSINRKHKEKLC